MMGRVVEDWDEPVVKTTKGLIIIPRSSTLGTKYLKPKRAISKNIVSMCVGCNQCTEICPRYLLGHGIDPKKLMVACAQGVDPEDPVFEKAQYCCECGLCELYACFMGLSPRRLNADLKREQARRKVRAESNKDAFNAHLLRQIRRLPTKRLKARLGISKYDRKPRVINEPKTGAVEFVLTLNQHIGAPCLPTVKQGAKVKAGQVVADVEEKKLGVPLHTPITGTVVKVDKRSIIIRKAQKGK
jgi:Na+-translocating ferredoxin:NAD+ oxidoreductase RnfC subunit